MSGSQERRSIAYFPPATADPSLPAAGNAWFLAEDFHNGLMPFRSLRGDASTFRVDVVPEDSELAGWVAGLLGARSPRAYELEDATCSFIRDVGQWLALSGEVFFEISETTTDGKPTVALLKLPPGRVTRILSRYVQWVPSHLQAQHGRCVVVPAASIWHVRLPKELGSPRRHRRMMRQLSNASGIGPPFTFEDGQFGATVPGYDFSAYHRAIDAEVEHLTRRWGGIPRLHVVKGATEYYFFERHAQWSRTQALVREHVIGEINVLFHRLRPHCRLVVDGLPTSAELLDVTTRLRKGEVGFAEVRNATRL